MKYILFVSFILVPIIVNADCVLNKKGDVVCARFPTGGAQLNHKGEVRCGWGKCVVNNKGFVKCSVVEGGGAMINDDGKARCLGGCENGQRNRCVHASP